MSVLRALWWVIWRMWLAVVVVVVWEWAARRAGNPFYPPPREIITGLRETWFSGPWSHLFLTPEAEDNLLPSLARLLGSWFAASALGILAGLALGRSRHAFQYVDPLVQFARALPPPVLLPVFITLFHLGTQMQVAMIMFGVIWPVLLNSIDGARGVNPVQMDTARAFRFSRYVRFRRVILPAAAPKIFAGLRLSLSLSLVLMVLSEFKGSTNGIGHRLNIAGSELEFIEMWGIVVLLGVLGYLLNTALLTVERRALRWNHQA